MKTSYAAVVIAAGLALGFNQAKSNETCTYNYDPKNKIEIGGTSYQMVRPGNPEKIIYFIPSIHTDSHIRKDEKSLADLISNDKIDGVLFEHLYISDKPYSSKNSELREPSLIKILGEKNTAIFGSKDSTFGDVVEFINAYAMKQLENSYENNLRMIGSLPSSPNYSVSGFTDKFNPQISKYQEEISSYESTHPDEALTRVNLIKKSYTEREELALSQIDAIMKKEGSKLGVMWGDAHTDNFVRMLCGSDYTIYVAEQEPIKVSSAEIETPTSFKEIYKLVEEMDLYVRNFTREVQEKTNKNSTLNNS